MGYFATISGAAECLLGDYEASVAALGAVDPFDEGAEFAKIFSCRLNVLYHLGYSLMMLKRYRDALAAFDGVLAHLARLAKHGGLQRFPAADQLVGIKAKLRLDDRKPIGAARLDAAGGADDIHFYVKGDMIHVDEPATQAARHDDFFANQMKKYDDYIEVVKGADAKPRRRRVARAAQDRD
ncbi:translation initiation factor [Aureococcus anophagefferens]|uniref:Translation initiation factor n=1 Tax=Aureococcus anophagefferens TaxID=44056 RepID=A0ABR1FIH6_AURAN